MQPVSVTHYAISQHAHAHGHGLGVGHAFLGDITCHMLHAIFKTTHKQCEVAGKLLILDH